MDQVVHIERLTIFRAHHKNTLVEVQQFTSFLTSYLLLFYFYCINIFRFMTLV